MLIQDAFQNRYTLNTLFDFHFLVIGVGGTGSELVPKLARQLSFKIDPLHNKFIHSLTICDADSVEEKNILRQNFFSSDIGKNKAEVIAKKCSSAFNYPVGYKSNYIESFEDLDAIFAKEDKVPFIIGCVDNTAVRKMLHEYFMQYKSASPIFYLDSGNEEFHGQVVLGAKFKTSTINYVPLNDSFEFNLPTVCAHYPEMLNTEEQLPSKISCAERAVSNPQAADANIEAATISYIMLSNVLRGNIMYHKVTFNVLYGNRFVSFNTENLLKDFKVRGLAKAASILSVLTETTNTNEVAEDDVDEEATDEETTNEEATNEETVQYFNENMLPNTPKVPCSSPIGAFSSATYFADPLNVYTTPEEVTSNTTKDF